MKKNMKVIFIIAVLFIIFVGLYGVINGNHKSSDKLSENNSVAKKETTTQEDIIEENEDVNSQINDAAEEKTLENATTREISEIAEDSINTDTEKSDKEQYITRLDSIITYYEDLWDKSSSLDMTSMKELKNQEYTKWDDELNTIYQQIKKKLPEEEFIVIRDAERQWITDRDEKAALAASKYTGGTMEGLEYMSVMTDITRERTYELVEIYFEK
jgi:uncharacterized protein YecT (DUF1311 family)